MKKYLVCTAVMACLLAAPAVADTDFVVQHKMHFPQWPDPTGWDINATFPKVLADDWTCSGTGLVEDVHFWGSWKDLDGIPSTDDVGNILSFRLSIHDNIIDGGMGYSIPGALLWEAEIPFSAVQTVPYDPQTLEGWFDPNTGAAIPDDHLNYWEYNIDLRPLTIPLFEQQEGNVYWLDVSAVVEDVAGAPQPMWGWKTADLSQYPAPYTGFHYLDDAVWGDMPNPFWQELRDPFDDHSLDMAFIITPEPSAVALLLLGAMTVAGRRRT